MDVLLVEDDELVADAIVRGLGASGFNVSHCESAEHARVRLAAERFDMAVVDIGLPGDDGLSLLRQLRAAGNSLPVLILTARYALPDKIAAFEFGADDFLMKPFEQAELAMRCRALIRRAGVVPTGILSLGRANIDLNAHALTIGSRSVELTRSEWLVLETLAHNLGRVVDKDRLLQALSGGEQELSGNALETHVSRLRTKLGDAAAIKTVRGLGYRLDEAHGPLT